MSSLAYPPPAAALPLSSIPTYFGAHAFDLFLDFRANVSRDHVRAEPSRGGDGLQPGDAAATTNTLAGRTIPAAVMSIGK